MHTPEQNLDGATIVRFAHAFESGGGVERYLDDLDHALLQRHSMTVIRLYLASDRSQLIERKEIVGRGRLIKIPLPLVANESVQSGNDSDDGGSWKKLVRDWVLYNPLIWRLKTEKMLLRRPIPRRTGQAVGAGAKLVEILRREQVDLIVLHFIGGSDSDEIVVEARKAGIPLVGINHFVNERFLSLSMRKHAMLANEVAGVSGIGVPRYLRPKFHNVSDGIDTDFFQVEHAKSRPDPERPPQIILPARVVRSKGHLDVVRMAHTLKKEGVPFRVAFAGRTDSEDFVSQLRAEIKQLGLEDSIQFLGSLDVEQLRDAYAASSIMVLPTYHEGLGRSIIEAEGMKLPVVAYATGGVSESMVHGETGYLVDTGDLPGFVARVEQLLRRPELRERMGQAGRALVEKRFSLMALATRHQKLYEKALPKNREFTVPLNVCHQD